MHNDIYTIRQAGADDLAAINRVITNAVMQWKLPARVKRLAMSSYLYRPHDLVHLELYVVETPEPHAILGVAALEPTATADLPVSATGMLLHGIYIDPAHQRSGLGRVLIRHVMALIAARSLSGLLVKAQPDAIGFFVRLGMQELPVKDASRDYPHRFWLASGHDIRQRSPRPR